MSNDGTHHVVRLIESFQRITNQLRNSLAGVTMELAQLQSMHNRTVRDLIEVRRRLADLEKTSAYRTKFSDENDPLKIRSE